jgi:hypothetical protein
MGTHPWGVNATRKLAYYDTIVQFQWAPTLGGECYRLRQLAQEFGHFWS